MVLIILAACQPTSTPAATRAPTPGVTAAAQPTATFTLPMTTTPPSEQGVSIEVVAEGLDVPWALAFAPDGRLFVTERPGSVRIIEGGRLLPEPFVKPDVARVSEAGLLGLALHPNFEDNGYVYLYYTYRGRGGRLWNRVVRLTDGNDRGVNPVVILDGIPGAGIHDGGRLKFGPDGKLYVTTGDAAVGSLAQQLDSLAGKILRLDPDGSIPEENPFPGSPVFSYGHRNPQGLAWHPITGRLFNTEHGPIAHDEVNLVQPGNNYGWPVVRGMARDSRFVDPVLESGNTTWAPSGATFYSGGKLPPEWRGKLFFGGLRGTQVHWVSFRAPNYTDVQNHGALFLRAFGRIRTVVQGPDGYLYFATNNRDGRGRPGRNDDRILRIVPAR